MKSSMWLVALIAIVLCCGAGCVATPAPSLQVAPVTVAVEPTVVEVAPTVVAVQVKEPVKEPEPETCTEYRLPGQNAPGFEDLYMTVDRNRGTAEITGSYMLDDRLDLIHETSMQAKTRIVQGRYFDDTARPRSGIVSTVEWRRQTDGSCVRGDEGEQFRIEAIRLEFRNDVLNIKSSAVITGPGEEGVWYRM